MLHIIKSDQCLSDIKQIKQLMTRLECDQYYWPEHVLEMNDKIRGFDIDNKIKCCILINQINVCLILMYRSDIID